MTGSVPQSIVTLDEYQRRTDETAIYPDELPEFVDAELLYVTLGLAGEAGELAEKLKKAIRSEDPSYLEDLEAELGDVLWYAARVAEERDTKLSHVATDNWRKLSDRADRGVIDGEGDDR